MHDLLLSNQSALEEADLVRFAGELGLDTGKFAENLRSRAHREKVHSDELSGVQSQVISTPTFFINGMRFHDTPDIERLGAAIRAALSAARFILLARA